MVQRDHINVLRCLHSLWCDLGAISKKYYEFFCEPLQTNYCVAYIIIRHPCFTRALSECQGGWGVSKPYYWGVSKPLCQYSDMIARGICELMHIILTSLSKRSRSTAGLSWCLLHLMEGTQSRRAVNMYYSSGENRHSNKYTLRSEF